MYVDGPSLMIYFFGLLISGSSIDGLRLTKKLHFMEQIMSKFSKFLMLKINHTFFKSNVTSDEIWASTETGEVIAQKNLRNCSPSFPQHPS